LFLEQKNPYKKKDMNNHTSPGHDGDKLICLTVTEIFRDVHIPKLEIKMTHGTWFSLVAGILLWSTPHPVTAPVKVCRDSPLKME